MSSDNVFKPIDFQLPLGSEELIVRDQPDTEDTVPLDVLFVGAGPAGLAGAIELSRLCKSDPELSEIEIGVLEKAETLGGHNLSGAVVNPIALKELFPDLSIEDFPFQKKVTKEYVYMMTEGGKFRLPTPPTMKNHGNYIASICQIVRWLGDKAEDLGINILTSFPADKLLVKGDAVEGVQTVAAGLTRDGKEGDDFMPPSDVKARVTVLSEGTRGPLTQAFLNWKKIDSKVPQIYALGVKEIWKVKKQPEGIIHTMGWPLPRDAFGGSFVYPMNEDLLAFGLVVGLDYKNTRLDVHELVQKFKNHPLMSNFLDGGELLEWGAKTIPEGGYHAIPDKLHGNGILITGDAAGFVNVPALKGIHYAMKSGILAARTIFKGLKAGDVSEKTLSEYDVAINDSYIKQDLYEVRNMRHAFKSGFYMGGLKAGLMTLTKGAFPGFSGESHEDADEEKTSGEEVSSNKSDTIPYLSKVDGVYKSSNKTRDDIPSHLLVKKDLPESVAKMYVSMCPAGVYEWDGSSLVVNAPNCVDCKATDVLGPRWRPREGGSGPSYQNM